MSDVDRLLSEYISEHRAGGEADPVAYLDQLEGGDREELAALLDAYLQRAPGRKWDAEAFRGSAAQRLTESLHRSLGGRAGLWPVVLPRLRERAQVKRAELVARLGAALGASDQEEKVASYYHGMEQGNLESAGVSDRVLGALGEIVGASAESLRKAGENLSEGMAELGSDKADAAFTRMRSAGGEGDEAESGEASGERMPEGEWDEVDELFRGRK